MCQYETQAAMPAITTVAATRRTARLRRWMGTRETSSTVSRRASGGQPAIASLIGLRLACRTLAANDADTPQASVSLTTQRTRLRLLIGSPCRTWHATPGLA